MLRWRVLVQYLTLSTLKAGQHNTILGYVWWVLDPLLLMLVYFVLVEVIFQRGVEHYPVFVLCAVVPWKWFSSSLLGSMASLVGKERLIKQVVFPKIVLPLSQVLSNLVSFAFGLGVLFLFVLGSGIAIKPIVLALPGGHCRSISPCVWLGSIAIVSQHLFPRRSELECLWSTPLVLHVTQPLHCGACAGPVPKRLWPEPFRSRLSSLQGSTNGGGVSRHLLIWLGYSALGLLCLS